MVMLPSCWGSDERGVGVARERWRWGRVCTSRKWTKAGLNGKAARLSRVQPRPVECSELSFAGWCEPRRVGRNLRKGMLPAVRESNTVSVWSHGEREL